MKMKSDFLLVFFVFMIIPYLSVFGQTIKENWLSIYSDEISKIYINTTGLDVNKSDDILLWVLEEFNSDFQIEGIDDNIFQSKTYYRFNKTKWRYSILQVIYFDEDKNVIKNYSYDNNTEIEDFKYNSPIIKDSSAEVILMKCIDLIK